jgi:hypothetical protein
VEKRESGDTFYLDVSVSTAGGRPCVFFNIENRRQRGQSTKKKSSKKISFFCGPMGQWGQWWDVHK